MDKIKKDILKACKREIDMATYYVGFYNFKATKLTEKADIDKNNLKIKQMEDAIKSNQEAIDMIKEYNKTL